MGQLICPMRCFILLSSTYPFFSSVGCFHSRSKLIGRGREAQVKWEQKQEQSCQCKKRNDRKSPSNQRSWKHECSLLPLITASPTSKCLQVRSDPLLECCTLWKMLPAEPGEGCVSVGANAVQAVTTCFPYSGEIIEKIDLRNVHFSIPFLIWKQNPETIGQVGCGFGFCFFSLICLIGARK